MGCNVTTEWVSGGILIRPMGIMKSGQVVASHKHNFDHTTIVFTGAVRIRAVLPDGTEIDRIFKSPRANWGGPSHALIRAGVEHEITALEDNTVPWCVYSHRDPQGEIVQQYNGWRDAYG